ncbi:hypothetical protein SAMN05660976_07792 [Nonomuraea pusilla]|uniref:Uncharacterized protein n=2 Tax=Nonomuraea pusilla TaxID=46177 RepID=A0A1H8HHK3_9ACTN|nr:hypothetical protein SAMN05660976_07792 [Nonomuraea pusilla]
MALYLREPAWSELLLGLGIASGGLLLGSTIISLGRLGRFSPAIKLAAYVPFRWLILQGAGPEKAAWIGLWASAAWLILSLVIALILLWLSDDSLVDERDLLEMPLISRPFGPLNLAVGLSRIAEQTGYCLLAAWSPKLALAPLIVAGFSTEWKHPVARQLVEMVVGFVVLAVGIGLLL